MCMASSFTKNISFTLPKNPVRDYYSILYSRRLKHREIKYLALIKDRIRN